MLRCLSSLFLLLPSAAFAAVDFSHQVVPVLKEYCADCHLGDKKKGGLSMNTREDMLAGSENGKIVEPGQPDAALLLKVLTSTDDDKMPPKGAPVPPEKVALLRQWIAEGMPWEQGFTFGKSAYDPPLKPRQVTLPASQNGREHPVDRIIDQYLTAHKTAAPGGVDDAVFLRRASMDITGLLPTPEEVAALPKDRSPELRSKIVAALLARDTPYTEHWLTFWNDLLRNDYQGTGYIDGGRKQITAWLYNALKTNKPYDEFARELLAPPSGDSEGFINGIQWRGSVNASQVREVQFSQSVSQVFLGINMKCASCHDSFVDKWKLDEAYALAAVYAEKPLEIFRCDKATGRQAKAGWIFPELGNIDGAAPRPERLKQLAGLMTHPDNGRFTRTIVNRIWHRLMGRGIVHPVDAMHTEPWSADLLDYLSMWFAEQKYDVKKLIAFICASEAYQSRSTPGPEQETAKYTYSGPVARKLSAEQFVDAVWQLTGTAPGKAGQSVPRAAGAAEELTGKWIWTQASGSAAAAAGETAVFKTTFQLPAAGSGGQAVVSCDNECEVFLDGKPLIRHDNWQEPSVVTLPPLSPGAHTVLIKAINGGAGPNPAGLFFEARVTQGKGTAVKVATGSRWEWAGVKNIADAGRAGVRWSPAAETSSQRVWLAVHGALSAGLTATGDLPVRASTVNSDLLMRALGRPNREQIVSMRPENLTTLEAIDLANGEILSNLLKSGAAKILKEWKGTGTELARNLFTRALSRPPTMQEAALLGSVAGPGLTAQAVEDMLWMILMLPEFQFVR